MEQFVNRQQEMAILEERYRFTDELLSLARQDRHILLKTPTEVAG